nr:receptor like protein 30-like isoform X2 [Ipomoea trifida]
MGKFLSWFVVLVIVANVWGCFGCLEEERIALLHVKAHIDNTYMRFLPSWVDEKKSDCCKWSRVTCSGITKRVIGLDLSLGSIWLEQFWNWYINASIFLPFKQLNYLDLSYSNLNGEIENGGQFSFLNSLCFFFYYYLV